MLNRKIEVLKSLILLFVILYFTDKNYTIIMLYQKRYTMHFIFYILPSSELLFLVTALTVKNEIQMYS